MQTAGSDIATQTPWLGRDYEAQDLIFNLDSDQRVKAGTLEALVVVLATHQRQDYQLQKVFMSTFRLFTRPHILIHMLSKRF